MDNTYNILKQYGNIPKLVMLSIVEIIVNTLMLPFVY
jgi:hypothetical protein